MPALHKRNFLPVFLLLFSQTILSQAVLPLKSGDTLPVRYLKSLLHSSKKKNTHSSGNPKLLLLHFWDKGCRESLKGIPALDSLQHKFPDQLQIILVVPEKKEWVEEAFRSIAYKPIGPTVIFEDTVLNKLFPHLTVPHHVWLSDKGKVLYITESFNANEKNVQEVLNGKKLMLIPKQDDSTYSSEIPLWSKVESTTHSPILYSSTLTSRLPGVSSGMKKIWDTTASVCGIRLINQDLLALFKVAFAANTQNEFNMNNRIILDVPNPEAFKLPEDQALWNDWLPRNIFNYELYVPIEKRGNMYALMQQDLIRYFGYEGRIESRKVKCLVLVKETNNNKLRSKGGLSSQKKQNGILSIRNLSIKASLYSSLKNVNQNLSLPFLNDTDDQKIDLDIKTTLTDIVALRKELQQYGLDVVEQERSIPMLVIRQTKDQ